MYLLMYMGDFVSQIKNIALYFISDKRIVHMNIVKVI